MAAVYPRSMSINLRWFLALYDDLLTWYPEHQVEIRRDQKTAAKRLKAGDLSFATKELPKIHNELLEALEKGGPAPKVLHLGWLAALALDHSDPHRQALALRHHRQVCHVLYKAVVPYDDATMETSIHRYVETENTVEHYASLIRKPGKALESILIDARECLRRALPKREEGLSTFLREHWGFVPRHGPGAVATGEKGEDKWHFKRHYTHLHSRFPYYEYFVVRGTDNLLDRLTWYRSLENLDDPSSKMVAVPKDSRGPRLICEEPLELQYIQQGYLRLMTQWASKSPLDGHVFFDSQEKHRSLALTSSADGRLATLDLKDASDRVSRELVKALFPAPIFRDLDAMRSTCTCLPNGDTLWLEKMSPMGSAVCFPTMAYTIWALCVVALRYHYGHEDWSHIHEYDIYIFGDDLIVPVDAVTWVNSVLTQAGLAVNLGKSYWRGPFRESCGMDACNGIEVTPIRVRNLASRRISSVETLLSWYAYINAFRDASYYLTALQLEKQLIERTLEEGGDVQYTWDPEMVPGIRVERPEGIRCPTRYSRRNGCVMALAWAPEPVSRKSTLAGELRLLRNLTQGEGERPDEITQRGEVKMRRRWRRALRP